MERNRVWGGQRCIWQLHHGRYMQIYRTLLGSGIWDAHMYLTLSTGCGLWASYQYCWFLNLHLINCYILSNFPCICMWIRSNFNLQKVLEVQNGCNFPNCDQIHIDSNMYTWYQDWRGEGIKAPRDFYLACVQLPFPCKLPLLNCFKLSFIKGWIWHCITGLKVSD